MNQQEEAEESMAEVMAPPSDSSRATSRHGGVATSTASRTSSSSLSPDPEASGAPQCEAVPRTRHREQPSQERIPSFVESRMSSYSKRSRPQSAILSLPSSLSYALVRDFAYPTFHPMHYGGPTEDPSGASTPASEWNAARRASDSAEATAGRGHLSAGPWADGLLYGQPGGQEAEGEPLPSTSFGSGAAGGDDWGEDETSFKKSKHRKSRSFADIPNYERGRRRESGGSGNRQSEHGGASGSDPAGREALRQSRGFQENGDHPRRDSHFATTLPSRSFHTSQPVDPDDEQIPLDAEPSNHSPQRESTGPEDEDLYAGPSLALYSFEPENDNELRLTEGQTILVAYRHGQGWLVAENPQTGEQGLVPEQYVRLLRDIEGWDEERGGFIDDDELEGVNNGVDELHIAGQGQGQANANPNRVPDHTLPVERELDYDAEMKAGKGRPKQ